MSNNLELPHEVLLRRYSLDMSELPAKTQTMKSNLERELNLIVARSKNGQVNVSPTLQAKLENYDRLICDDIFELLEKSETITETQSEKLETQMDAERVKIGFNIPLNCFVNYPNVLECSGFFMSYARERIGHPHRYLPIH